MSSHEAHKAKPAAKRLAAKIALITGGSRGIGAAIALRLAADGARVVISYKRNRAAADKILSLAGNDTKIVAGHGPLGNKADLSIFRDMLVISRDRVEKLKSAGKSAQEAVEEKPFADLDTMWGKGIVNSEQWVQIVYLTL